MSFTIGLDPVSDRTPSGGTPPTTPTETSHGSAVTTARTATIPPVTVGLDEPDETFLVELSSPVNATLDSAADEATGTITDNDGATARCR